MSKFRSKISTYAALFVFFIISSSFLTVSQGSQTVLGTSVSDFPEFPQPGSPILKDIPLQVNVIFMGIPEGLIDINSITEELPKTYSPIQRGKHLELDQFVIFNEFDIEYRFSFSPANFANSYAIFIQDNHREDIAPWWLQEKGVAKSWYIDVAEAESWVTSNAPFKLDVGYTMIIVDTFHTNPKIKDYYFYNASRPDLDMGRDPAPERNMFSIAFGGSSRYLVLDLTAGPSNYRDTPNIKLIVDYAENEAAQLNEDLAFYVQSAVELRFVPSYLYTPVYRPSYFVNVTIFSKDPSFSYAKYFNKRLMLDEFHELLPFSTFSGEVGEVPAKDDEELFQVIDQATDQYGIMNHSIVVDYILANRGKYVSSHGDDYVIPVFVFGGYQSEILGIAAGDENGDFAFVADVTDHTTLGISPMNVPIFSGEGGLAPDKWAYEAVLMNYNMRMTIRLNVESGELLVFVVDAYNLWLYTQTEDIDKISFTMEPEVWRKGSYEKTISPSAPQGKYYLVVSNFGKGNAIFSGDIFTTRTLAYGLTWTTIHEGGHSLGLSHPHDGFSWKFYEAGIPEDFPGEYAFWLWDFSDTPMTYAMSNPKFDQLDKDTMYRGIASTLLNETFTVLKNARENLEERGFENVPSEATDDLSSAAQSIDRSLELFKQLSPDYLGALQEALNAFASAQKAFATVQSAQLPMRFSEFYWLIAIALVAVVVIVVFVFLRKSRRRALAKVPVQPQVPAYPKKYCTNCGAELPLEVEFCLRCGAGQE